MSYHNLARILAPTLLHTTALSTCVITVSSYSLSIGFVLVFVSTRQALYSTEPYTNPLGISASAFPLSDHFLLKISYHICHSASVYFIYVHIYIYTSYMLYYYEAEIVSCKRSKLLNH